MNTKPVFPNDPSTCTHKPDSNAVWLCNDATIEMAYPTYFDYHPRTEPHLERTVCTGCGSVRIFLRHEPIKGIKVAA